MSENNQTSSHHYHNHPNWDQYHQSTPKLLPPTVFEKTTSGASMSETSETNSFNMTLNPVIHHTSGAESLTSLGHRPTMSDYGFIYGTGGGGGGVGGGGNRFGVDESSQMLVQLSSEIEKLRFELKKLKSENEGLRHRNKG